MLFIWMCGVSLIVNICVSCFKLVLLIVYEKKMGEGLKIFWLRKLIMYFFFVLGRVFVMFLVSIVGVCKLVEICLF